MGEECSERVTYTLRGLQKVKLTPKFRGSEIIQLENIRTATMEEVQSVHSRSYVLSVMQDVVKYGDEKSKLLLCEATAVVMKKCFYLLGITPICEKYCYDVEKHNLDFSKVVDF
ncbi:hypothetical protein Tco_1576792 [Tanacetum coccineum]